MGLKAMNIQGVVPAEIELQSPQHLQVGQVVHFLEHGGRDEGNHRHIGPPVVRVVETAKGFLVDEGQDLLPEWPGPGFFEGRDALVRKVDIVVEDGLLKALRSEQGKVS